MLFIKTMSQMSEDNQKLLLNLIQNLSNKDSDKKEDNKKKERKEELKRLFRGSKRSESENKEKEEKESKKKSNFIAFHKNIYLLKLCFKSNLLGAMYIYCQAIMIHCQIINLIFLTIKEFK